MLSLQQVTKLYHEMIKYVNKIVKWLLQIIERLHTLHVITKRGPIKTIIIEF
jgi:hypothetical protein